MDLHNQNEFIVEVKQLDSFGIKADDIIKSYFNQTGIELKLNEKIKVSPKDEGKHINFETWDHISIVVPFNRASGNWNKVEKPE